MRGKTLVRRVDDDAWRRLDEVIPDWERHVRAAEPPAPEFDEQVLHVFRPSAWLYGLYQVAMPVPVLFVVMLVMRRVDVVFLSVYALALFVGAFVRGYRERVEVSAHMVRTVAGHWASTPIRLDEIDRASAPPNPWVAVLMGDWLVRSVRGPKLVLIRRAYSADDIRRLSSLLGVQLD